MLSDEDIAGAVVSQASELLKAGVNASDITVLCWKNSDISLISEVLSSEGIKSVNEGTLELKKNATCRSDHRVCENFAYLKKKFMRKM